MCKLKRNFAIILLLTLSSFAAIANTSHPVLTVVNAPTYPLSVNMNNSVTATYTFESFAPVRVVPRLLTHATTISQGSITETGGTCSAGVTKLGFCTIQLTYTSPTSLPGNITATANLLFGYGGRNNVPPQTARFSVLTMPDNLSISPTSGTVAGGTFVTISGNNLQNTTSVTFDGTNASISANTPTSVTVITPAHAAGPVDVTITTPNGSGTISNGYTYSAMVTVSPSLMLLSNTPGVSNGSGTGSVVVTNSSTSAVSNITASVSGTNLSIASNGCSGTLAIGASCTINFTSSNVTADASSGKSITISSTTGHIVPTTVAIAALGVIVMSPPYQSNTGVSMLLVAGCSTPQILEIVNNSTSAITGISATADGTLTGTTLTNYCNGITLGQNKICMIQVTTNTAVAGNSGSFFITNTSNTQQIPISAKVEAVNANGDLPLSIGAGRTKDGDVIYASENGSAGTCNLVRTVSKANASGAVRWARSSTYQTTRVPFPGTATNGAVNINRGQPNTISIVAAEQGQGQSNTSFAAGVCTNYTETISPGVISTNWYLPSICELAGNNFGGGISAGCTNANNNIYINGATSSTNKYWSSTEKNATDAWVEDFINSFQGGDSKNKLTNFVTRCSRQFTD